MNAEMVARLERSFEARLDNETAKVIIRMGVELTDAEQQLATANLRLAELALCLRLAVYHIPKDALESDPKLKDDVDQWLKESQELLDAPDQLMREAEEKTKRFMDATERLGKMVEELKARKASIQVALDFNDDVVDTTSRKRSRSTK